MSDRFDGGISALQNENIRLREYAEGLERVMAQAHDRLGEPCQGFGAFANRFKEVREMLMAAIANGKPTASIPTLPNPEPALALLGEAPATAPAVGLPGAAGEGPGKVTITTNEAGDCVAVTRTDDEGRILSVLWERDERHEIDTQPLIAPDGIPEVDPDSVEYDLVVSGISRCVGDQSIASITLWNLRTYTSETLLSRRQFERLQRGEEPTEAMVIAGFESDAFNHLADLYTSSGGPSCKQAAEAVRGIYKSMEAARCS
jgi:hypothetical protein